MITTNLETLRLKSNPFEGTEEERNSLIQCLEFDLEHSQRRGIGLSGIQINIPVRVAIIRIPHKYKKEIKWTKYDLWNAEIIEKSQPFVYKGEGCLSIPDVFKNTNRFNQIKVKNGDGEVFKISGIAAVAIQHEMDHWDGVIFLDRKTDGED